MRWQPLVVLGRSGLLLGLAFSFLSVKPFASAHAALSVTPPQLHLDEAGVVVTEVQSSLTTSSRWSVRLVGWGPAGEEQPGAEGLVAPRFFSLAPGGRQLVRARIANRARYHRLLIEQIPEANNDISGLAFRFRFSLPVYRLAQEPVAFKPNLANQDLGGCQSFTNPKPQVVRLELTGATTGPQVLLPGETAELCSPRGDRLAKNVGLGTR
jgi:P pilus assembly chaperone PapD